MLSCVPDTGSGILPESAGNLFEPSYVPDVLKQGGSSLWLSVFWGLCRIMATPLPKLGYGVNEGASGEDAVEHKNLISAAALGNESKRFAAAAPACYGPYRTCNHVWHTDLFDFKRKMPGAVPDPPVMRK